MVRMFDTMSPMHQNDARIGDGDFQLLSDASGITVCVDPFYLSAVQNAREVPGVRVWESHRGETWLACPYNAVPIVELMLGTPATGEVPVELPRLHAPPRGSTQFAIKPPLYSKLRDYQRAVFDLFHTPECGQRLLLGDAMGLGKTLTTIACFQALPGPKLIMGPKGLRATWRDELRKWAPGEPFHYVETLNPTEHYVRQLPPVHEVGWLYIHYDIVHAWWSWLRMYRFVAAVCDEAHVLRNVKTKRGEGVALAMGSVGARMLLTGTPVENRTSELHHLLQLVTGPGTWGGKGAFRIRYAGARPGAHGGLEDGKPTNREELHMRIYWHYRRRTPAQVGELVLPPLQRIPRTVALDEDAKRKLAMLYDDPSVLHAVQLFQQTGKLPSAENNQAIKAITKLRKATSVVKVPETVRVVLDHFESHAEDPAGGQVLVFTWTREMAEKIAKAVRKSGTVASGCVHVVTGDLTQNARDTVVDDFRADARNGHSACLVATYGALGTGVNLQCANAVVMHDMDWIPGVMLQAEARPWRGGQERSVSSYWMIAEGSFDEYIIGILLAKADEIAASIGDNEPQKLREAFAAYAEKDVFDDYAKRLRAWQENRIV